MKPEEQIREMGEVEWAVKDGSTRILMDNKLQTVSKFLASESNLDKSKVAYHERPGTTPVFAEGPPVNDLLLSPCACDSCTQCECVCVCVRVCVCVSV